MKGIIAMELNMKLVQYCAEKTLNSILKDVDVGYTAEIGKETGTLTLKLEKSIGVCGYNALMQFMFMKDGEVYFFTMLDQIDLTVENAAYAFEASTATALNIVIDEYLTVQLGAYLFDEKNAVDIMFRYIDDMVHLIEKDPNMKKLLNKMY
jgi:hypothetical protein